MNRLRLHLFVTNAIHSFTHQWEEFPADYETGSIKKEIVPTVIKIFLSKVISYTRSNVNTQSTSLFIL